MPQKSEELARGLILEERIDWVYFIKLTRLYATAPLIYRHLQSFGKLIPEAVMQSLRGSAGFVFARNIKYFNNVKSLADMFNKEGLEVIFMKGVVFMIDLYREKGLRDFSDIDILIKQEDLAKVEKLVKRKGFKPYNRRGIFNRYRSQRVYSLDGKLCLDIHLDLIGRKMHNRLIGINKKDLWSKKRKVSLEGTHLYALDTSHMLIYQSMHLAMQHGFSGLKWYVDIHELVRSYKINWAEVVRLAKSYRVARPLYYTLLFTRNMFATPIPEKVLGELGKIQRKFDRYLLEKIKSRNAETDYLAELFMFDRMRDTIKFIFLSLIAYPYLIGHFVVIFGKILKSILPGRKPMAVSS